MHTEAAWETAGKMCGSKIKTISECICISRLIDFAQAAFVLAFSTF